jgi:uncharacterized membrane protein YeaQ/YmgE (transglycosylase-associated protein family)
MSVATWIALGAFVGLVARQALGREFPGGAVGAVWGGATGAFLGGAGFTLVTNGDTAGLDARSLPAALLGAVVLVAIVQRPHAGPAERLEATTEGIQETSFREITSQIEIGAPAGRVWEVLLDFGSYREWNPFITAISATTRNSTQLKLETRRPGQRTMRSRASLLTVEPGRRLTWREQRLIPGLPKREHAVRLEPLSGGRVRVELSLRVIGMLAPLFARSTAQRSKGLDQMNEALKRRAEVAPEVGRAPRAA